tara:strand:- start:1225 stop:1920 length:696 start_codon:yes stop_codon:yes gene_type:complete
MLGHVYKNCTKPITSYGIILIDNRNMENKYLLIQRKNSIAFNEFIFGKYSLNSPDYIKRLFNRMSTEEMEILKTQHDYKKLWNRIYFNNNYNKNIINKFYNFLKKYKNFINDFTIIENQECEWEFPKGRRNNNESDLECACREFTEETNIDISNIRLTNHKFYEEFVSTNNNTYLHVYYLAYLKNTDLILSKKSCYEVHQIKWFNYDESMLKIRFYSFEKKKVLLDIERLD